MPLHTSSEAFKSFLKLFTYLKFTPNPNIQKLKPKICLTCWEVYTVQTELYHSDQTSHKYTNEFSRMAEADQKALIKIGTAHNKWKRDEVGEEGAGVIEMFKIDEQVLKIAEKELGLVFLNIAPETMIPNVNVAKPSIQVNIQSKFQKPKIIKNKPEPIPQFKQKASNE